MPAKSPMSKYGRVFQMYQRRTTRWEIQSRKLLSHRPADQSSIPTPEYWQSSMDREPGQVPSVQRLLNSAPGKRFNLEHSWYFNIDRFISDPHQTLHVHKGQKLVAMQIFAQSKELLEDEIRRPLDGHGLHFLLSTGNISYIMHLW